MISEGQKQVVLDYLKPLNPVKIGIFGSYARGENKKDSDLDILIHLNYPNKISLLKLVSIEQDISDALGIPIDLITERALSPHIRPYIEKDLYYIFQ